MNLILANSNDETTHAPLRPIKIIILFEENLNACSAEVFIKHLTSNYPCGTKPFSIEESGSPFNEGKNTDQMGKPDTLDSPRFAN
jgi:hypothetical protein